MRLHLSIIFALALLSCPIDSQASDDPYIQYLPEFMPQAPTAQAIARAIDIPVDYYTGVPNISIPLYTIQSGGVSVPITLNYQGGGIRPAQEATCVGLGWALTAGGAVTRTVKCADDFMEHRPSGSQFVYGFFDRKGWPDMTKAPDYNYYRRLLHGDNPLETNWSYYLCADSEPDLFFFSIPGYSGKFSFKKDKSIVYFDKSANVKINLSYGNERKPLFYAIDPNGNGYCFETKERTHVFSAAGGMNVNNTSGGVDIANVGGHDNFHETSDFTSTWFLTRITSATNDTIDFEYSDEGCQLPLQENCRYQRRISGPGDGPGDGDGPIYSMSKTEIEGKRLSSIKWRGGKVLFKYGSARQDLTIGSYSAACPLPLTDVMVYNTDNLLVCHWHLTYSYFNKDLDGIAKGKQHLFKRLKLCSARNMLDGQDPYKFSYNEEVAMPAKNTRNLDYWGYYNGTDQGEIYYCLKDDRMRKGANGQYAQMGILEAVTHPTDGTTRLHWESNKTGENIKVDDAKSRNYEDSYTKGCLQACDSGSNSVRKESHKAVLLSQKAKISLLLSSEYLGKGSAPSNGGTPFAIDKINGDGSRSCIHLWNVGTIGDEYKKEVALEAGTYEFKCSAAVADVKYTMFFVDSINILSTKKENKGGIFCYMGDSENDSLQSDSAVITLNGGGFVFFSYNGGFVDNDYAQDSANVYPFRIEKKNTAGLFKPFLRLKPSASGGDTWKALRLSKGTYKLKCRSVTPNTAYFLNYEYGDVKYTSPDAGVCDNTWDSKILSAYNEKHSKTLTAVRKWLLTL